MRKIPAYAAIVGVALSTVLVPNLRAADKPVRKILFFSKSAGFEHPMIQERNGMPSKAEKLLKEIGAKNHYEFTFTKDGSVFTPENIAKYDAFFFYTTGDLTTVGTDGHPAMSPEGKAAFLEAIHNGKGFIGTHSATDTFHSPNYVKSGSTHYDNDGDNADPYIKMIGGEFIIHGQQQKAHMIVVDSKFPGVDAVGADFAPPEEWYALKNFAPNLHVILAEDTQGMKGEMYHRPVYPATWAHMYGKGRVFYTNMGHRDDIWTNPVFQSVLVGGIDWAVKNADADVTPNLSEATPHAAETKSP